jgi:hypothetical protein
MFMMYRRLLILLLFFAIANKLLSQNSKDDLLKFHIDTIKVNVTSTFAGEYPRRGTIFESYADSLLVYFFNPKLFQIDRINITKKSQLPPVMLSKDGPNKVLLFNDFTVYNNNLYFYSPVIPEISCSNMQGVVLKRYRPNLPDSLRSILSFFYAFKDISTRGIWSGFHSTINIINNNAYLPIYPLLSKFSKDFFKYPSYIIYNLNIAKVEKSNVLYPKKLADGSHYGDLIESSVSEITGNIYLSYAFTLAPYNTNGSIQPDWLAQKENKEIFSKEISESNYLDIYKNAQHIDGMNFGQIQKDIESPLCIKPLFSAKFEGANDIFPKESLTAIYIYNTNNWQLINKITIPGRSSLYLYNRKIYIMGSLISADRGDYFEIFVIDLSKN